MANKSTTNTPAHLTAPVMTNEIGSLLETRLTALEKHYQLGDNALGCAFGRGPVPTNGNTTMWIGKIWIGNGLIDVANVAAPSLDVAINRAFEDATLMLPQYQGKTAKVA